MIKLRRNNMRIDYGKLLITLAVCILLLVQCQYVKKAMSVIEDVLDNVFGTELERDSANKENPQ
jgi:hypothetical protein